MLSRRTLLAAAPTLLLAGGLAVSAHAAGFEAFLEGVRAEGLRGGISAATLSQALGGIQSNPKVLELDRRQPEFTMTWERYRSTRLSEARITKGRAAFARNRRTLEAVYEAYHVDPRVIMGVWGLESNYGGFTGGFNVVEALATLAWDGRRASFFRAELMAALRILDHGDVAFPRMLGSYAGAMGQPQFMPSSFARYAVDFDGSGRRDIWDNTADVLASIANYLAKSGWRNGIPWGYGVVLPTGFDAGMTGRENRRAVAEWGRLGVRRASGTSLPASSLPAAVVLPDGAAGEAFLVFGNFSAIRRYNPSDYYALSVGLLGDLVTA